MANYAFDVQDLLKQEKVDQESIDIINEWCTSNDKIPNIPAQEICLFLMACNSNLENVKHCIENYYKIRLSTPHIFENRSTLNEDIVTQLKHLNVCLLPRRTKKNYSVIVQRLSDPSPSNYHMDIALKYLFMVYDAIVYKNPPDGVILIFDMDKCSIRHITRTKIGLLRILIHYVEDCVPLKILEIHVMNSVWFLQKFLNLIKPFMNKELINKIHPHLPDDLDEFYENVPQSHLPLEYGGFLPSIGEIHQDTYEMLTSLNDDFAQDELKRKEFLKNITK